MKLSSGMAEQQLYIVQSLYLFQPTQLLLVDNRPVLAVATEDVRGEGLGTGGLKS
jgi:hypothetical protein